MRGIYIEWLKSKRTKSFSIVLALMSVAILWNIFTFSSMFSNSELKGAGILFSNQNVNLLILPVAVCLFAARIVGNEREGRTFKLQVSNGQNFLTIFHHKFLFMMTFFSTISILEITVIYFWGNFKGISIPLDIVVLQLVGQLLAVCSLICIYLPLAIFLEKQGLLLTTGLLGGFLGIVLNPRKYDFFSLLNPLTSSGSLAPYKYQFLGNGIFTYTLDERLLWKVVFYALHCLLLYCLVNIILRKRGN